MKTRAKILAAAVALAAAAGVFAQNKVDKSFTASETNDCTQINWAPEMLAKHPKIASACQEVMHRDGRTYVKFEGEVKKVSKGGKEVVMDMKGGDKITLNPDPEKMVYVGGNKVKVKNLRPGDTLTFYVPDGRVVAAVMETPTAPVEEIPISEAPMVQVAQTETTYDMPKTASSWPLVALFGALAIGFAGLLRARRANRGH
jgi:hypothetical protein